MSKVVLAFLLLTIVAQSMALCDNDPNAEPGCKSNYCGQRCFQTSTIACPHVCIQGGCRCMDGYKYDTVVKKCVLPEDCTPVDS